jgi:hypothetical protein
MTRLLIVCALVLMTGCSQRGTEALNESPETALSNEDAPVALKWEQRTCPFQSKIIDPGLFYDWEGKRIYTCCQTCLPMVKEDPERAIRHLAARGEYPLTIEAAKEREARLGPFDYEKLPGLDDVL